MKPRKYIVYLLCAPLLLAVWAKSEATTLGGAESVADGAAFKPEAAPLPEGEWVIQSLDIISTRYQSVSESFVRSHLGLNVGDKADASALERATKQLHRTGWINSARWEIRPSAAGEVQLRLIVDICPKIEGFKIVGNKNYSDNALIYEMKSRVHAPLNQQRLQEDVIRLKNFYISKGFLHVTIDANTQPGKSGYERICLQINEGARLKIKDICFEGVHAFKPNVLRDLVTTKPWGIFSWLTRTGRYNEEKLLQDIEAIRSFYVNAGYLDVVIDRAKVRLEERNDKLRIVFNIQEGDRYYLKNITVTSDIEDDNGVLRSTVPLKTGDPASASQIEAACEAIRDYYGRRGFVNAEVKVQRLCVDDNFLNLHFLVTRGMQYRIHSIYITGNVHTHSKVILRELNLAPGDVLNRTRMKKAEQRLQNTGFFRTVLVSSEECNIPYERDLKIALEENKTGSIFFSGAINSVEKLTFGVTLSQNNFDYQNSKDYFRGAGQKFQLGTSFGKYSNEIDLSFEEPWLYDRELRFGFNLFRTMNKIDSDNYKEVRLGGEVYIGKRLFEQVEGRLYYHLERFQLNGVKASEVSRAILDERGSRVISKVGFTLERDTRDNFIYPTRGSYLSWDNQIAGLGGKTKYFRTRVTAAQWFLVNPDHEQTLLIGGKTGWMRGFSNREIPLFEREFLGGPDDLRGFDYREVGPKTNDKYRENLGGKSFAYLKTEYSVKTGAIVRVVGFFDVGQVKKVNDRYVAPKSGGWNSDAGIGLRIHVLGAPFRLDFSFPLKTDAYNKKKAPYIAYSFGVSF